MSESSYIGDVQLWAGPWVPRNWLVCAGQSLPINQYQALYAVIGVTYGGNGVTTFDLPDLRTRTVLGAGNTDFGTFQPGQVGGEAAVSLQTMQMPAHTHTFQAQWGFSAQDSQGASATPSAGQYVANAYAPAFSASVSWYVPASNSSLTALGGSSAQVRGGVQPAGASQPHNNMQPWTALQYIIAVQGLFPPHS